MALDFLQSQRWAYADLADKYGELEELYTRKCVCGRGSPVERCLGRVGTPSFWVDPRRPTTPQLTRRLTRAPVLNHAPRPQAVASVNRGGDGVCEGPRRQPRRQPHPGELRACQ